MVPDQPVPEPQQGSQPYQGQNLMLLLLLRLTTIFFLPPSLPSLQPRSLTSTPIPPMGNGISLANPTQEWPHPSSKSNNPQTTDQILTTTRTPPSWTITTTMTTQKPTTMNLRHLLTTKAAMPTTTAAIPTTEPTPMTAPPPPRKTGVTAMNGPTLMTMRATPWTGTMIASARTTGVNALKGHTPTRPTRTTGVNALMGHIPTPSTLSMWTAWKMLTSTIGYAVS
mmetsp:Transcript_4170/g.10323  ORF Transcript_4170/g.10323 Transcript_4170/m.10323 type:complete len:225 (-) Transcript_4170:1736-2410(-)